MPNMKALSERVRNLRPMSKLSNKQKKQQTDRAKKNKPLLSLPGTKKNRLGASEVSFVQLN